MEKAELKEAVNESIKELLAESGFIVGGYTPGYLGRAEVYCSNLAEVYCSNLDDLISYIRGELS